MNKKTFGPCGVCDYYLPDTGGIVNIGENEGVCARFPPQCISVINRGQMGMMTCMPKVNQKFPGCGEFKPLVVITE